MVRPLGGEGTLVDPEFFLDGVHAVEELPHRRGVLVEGDDHASDGAQDLDPADAGEVAEPLLEPGGERLHPRGLDRAELDVRAAGRRPYPAGPAGGAEHLPDGLEHTAGGGPGRASDRGDSRGGHGERQRGDGSDRVQHTRADLTPVGAGGVGLSLPGPMPASASAPRDAGPLPPPLGPDSGQGHQCRNNLHRHPT